MEVDCFCSSGHLNFFQVHYLASVAKVHTRMYFTVFRISPNSIVVSAICTIMDEINTEHNMKSICRPVVAQWTERLTRKGQTRVQIWKGANILLSPILLSQYDGRNGTLFFEATLFEYFCIYYSSSVILFGQCRINN